MLFKRKPSQDFKYQGTRAALDGNTAVIYCERESSDAAGAYPITPSTQMGEMWAEEVSKGHINISGRSLVFIEPESEHAAAAVTAGLSMTGMRAINFSSAQGVAFMHESLYAAAGKRLPYILNIGCRAITKAALNVHASHDDYHCVDDTGFFQVFAKNAQEAADLNIIAHKVSELALNPGIVGQDGFLTTHLIESMKVPERELIAEFLGRPDDMIECPTPAQKMIFGEKRRRIPAIWDVDNPMVSGALQNQDAYMQQVAAQRPYFFDHVAELTDQCMEEFYQLTGRRYARASGYRTDDAEYLIVGQGSMVATAEAVADHLRETRGIKLGVVNITMFRPFPGNLLAALLKGRKGVAVLERTDQPLAEDLPLMRETRSALGKAIENGLTAKGEALPYPAYPAFDRNGDIPRLYSGAFGLGSRDLQPEGLIAAVENMLPEGGKRTFFYLSVDFIRDQAASPKQELHQQALLEAYPNIKHLALRGSENPSLMPEGAIAVRLHSVGGWGAMTTGKNLAMTLFDLLDFHIKANPKYGSEKKGQPTTYYLAAAPEPIRISNELKQVDVVLSPDPNVFDHSDPLSGLNKGGVFIIQSSLENPEAVWRSFPAAAQRYIRDNEIRVFYLDAFKIARDEASNADLQFRMQGIAFQGAFFAASPVMQRKNLTEQTLFTAIEEQLQEKFGGKGARVVQDNLRVVRRGFDELLEITDKQPTTDNLPALADRSVPEMPVMLKRVPQSLSASGDIHRFWEQTGSFYISGQGNDNLVDPFIGMSLIPASTGIFRDMTQIRFDYPEWLPEKCTACGDCYTVCPDSAIPGLVHTPGEVFETAVRRIEIGGKPTRHLRRAVRDLEKRLRNALTQAGDGADVGAELDFAITHLLAETDLQGDDKARLEKELGWLKESIGDFQFAVTRPFFTAMEKRAKGSGGLFSLTLNPYTCKGCMECVSICEDKALVVTPQTPESVDTMRRNWDFWMDLPTTRPDYIRIEDLDEGIGALETLLLDKKAYGSLNCGDSACLGCGEKTTVHLFTATVTALMQPRVKAQLKKLDDLISGLEQHVRLKLAEGMDLSNVQAVNQVIGEHADKDLTLARLSTALDASGGHTVDPDWLQWVTGVLAKLKDLRWRYLEGPSGRGRTEMGVINATGCTSVWGSTFPYSPYPFPWASHLFQDTPSMAMGIFEGHMAKMAEGFKAIRMAELELAGTYNPVEHEPFFAQFNWEQFSDEEFHLCPPVVGIGGDGAMYDIGFQNLSRALMSGMPIKVLVVDTQVYSNTGGQACTSGFISQVSDMAPYGKAWKGKEEIRKEISLIGLAHRTSYVMQGAISHVTHLLESFIEGLNARRPALFNVYAVCPPEHGVGDDVAFAQSKLAVESRAYPLFRYNPDKGTTFRECCTLEGNPAIDQDWPTYTLKYQDEDGGEATMELPMTFADFALTEGRFRKHFRKAPVETWNDDMVPMAEFLAMSEDEREGRFPYVWGVDDKNRLNRVLVSEELVRSAEERLAFWHQLKGLLGLDHEVVDVEAVAAQTRADMAQRLSGALLSLVSGDGAAKLADTLQAPAPVVAPAAPVAAPVPTPSATPVNGANGNGHSNGHGNGHAAQGNGLEYEPVWVETTECTACDECVQIAPGVFAYDDNRQAVVTNPQGAPYKDIVRAAEKCTVLAVHPGTPFNPNEPDAEKLMKRAMKFN